MREESGPIARGQNWKIRLPQGSGTAASHVVGYSCRTTRGGDSTVWKSDGAWSSRLHSDARSKETGQEVGDGRAHKGWEQSK